MTQHTYRELCASSYVPHIFWESKDVGIIGRHTQQQDNSSTVAGSIFRLERKRVFHNTINSYPQGCDRVPGGRGVRLSGRLPALPHQLPGRGQRRGVRPHRRPRQHPRHELEGGI